MLVFSSQIYPELPGALLIVVGLRIMVTRASLAARARVRLDRGRPARLAARSLHSAVRRRASWARRRGVPGAASRPARPASARRRVVRAAPGELAARRSCPDPQSGGRVTVPVAVPYLGNVALFAAVSHHLYGKRQSDRGVPPVLGHDRRHRAAGPSCTSSRSPTSSTPSTAGSRTCPVHWLGLAALGCLVLRWRWAALACIAVPVGYELVLASAGPDLGLGFPARYLIPVIPLVAVPIALAIAVRSAHRDSSSSHCSRSRSSSPLAAVHEPRLPLPRGREAADLRAPERRRGVPAYQPRSAPDLVCPAAGGRRAADRPRRGRRRRRRPRRRPRLPLRRAVQPAEARGATGRRSASAVTGARPDDVVAGIDATSAPPLRRHWPAGR